MYNVRNIAWQYYKMDYYTGQSARWFSYFHSIITGACFAWFIGLFSAGPDKISDSTALWMATLLFSLSFLLNFCFSLFYKFLDRSRDREMLFNIHTFSITGMLLTNAALFLPVLAFVFLLFFFSASVGVVTLLSLAVLLLLTQRVPVEIKRVQKKIEKEKKRLLAEKNYQGLLHMDKMYNFPILSPEEEQQRLANFYIYTKLLGIISSAQKNDACDIDELREALLAVIYEEAKTLRPTYEISSRLIKIIKIILPEKEEQQFDRVSLTDALSQLRDYIEKNYFY